MRLVKEIEIVFENCEVARIPVNAIGTFYIGLTHNEIRRVSFNAICEDVTTYEVVFELRPEASILTVQQQLLGGMNIIERIQKYSDITALNILYEDGGQRYIFVDYDDGGDERLGTENKNQKSHLSSKDSLYVVISKEKKISDFFDETVL